MNNENVFSITGSYPRVEFASFTLPVEKWQEWQDLHAPAEF